MDDFVEIELTVAQVDNVRAQFVQAHGAASWGRVLMVGDTLVVPDDLAEAVRACDPDDASIAIGAVKEYLKASIDAAAEAERLKYITAGTGQAMTYQRKVQEAHAATAEQDPDPADYPLLSASIGIDGPDLAAVAAVILGMDAAWAQIGAAIEAVRLSTKKTIDEAVDEAAARAAADAAIWPA